VILVSKTLRLALINEGSHKILTVRRVKRSKCFKLGLRNFVAIGQTVKPLLRYGDYWATACKKVRPVLSDRCLSVCLSVCLSCPVWDPGHWQTVAWIKMKLRTQVGLGPGYIVLCGDPAPSRKRAQKPPLLKFTGADCLRPYNPRPMSIVAKRLDSSR